MLLLLFKHLFIQISHVSPLNDSPRTFLITSREFGIFNVIETVSRKAKCTYEHQRIFYFINIYNFSQEAFSLISIDNIWGMFLPPPPPTQSKAWLTMLSATCRESTSLLSLTVIIHTAMYRMVGVVIANLWSRPSWIHYKKWYIALWHANIYYISVLQLWDWFVQNWKPTISTKPKRTYAKEGKGMRKLKDQGITRRQRYLKM